MTYSEAEIQAAAARAEALSAPTVPMDDTTDLRAVADAAGAVRADEALLREKVAVARANGRSWGQIGASLGVSRQAARERFAEKITA
jgi:hypothetical protein